MFEYFLPALIIAVLSALPLWLRKALGAGTAFTIIYGIAMWILFYLATPALMGPLGGAYGGMLFVGLVIAFILSCFSGEDDDGGWHWTLIFPVGFLVVGIIVAIYGSAFFQSQAYASYLPKTDPQVWTENVQPKDPSHMRMASKENALSLADLAIGELGAVKSQYHINEEGTTLQMVNGQLWWVMPLDFASVTTWYATGTVPAYIMVDAENPNRAVKPIKLEGERAMKYTPGAFFSYNLERHMRNNGYLSRGLIDFSFEIDESLREWWVVSVYHLELAGNVRVIDGVAIVDPFNGDIKYYPTGETPDWVDRVTPDDIVKDYLKWQGEYTGGWANAWFWKLDVTEPEQPKMIYGSNGEPEWVTSITAKKSGNSEEEKNSEGTKKPNKNSSLVAMVYTNSRTGKSVWYDINGGGTDETIVSNINNNEKIGFKKLHGTDPQIYNIYGHVAAVVPLLNANHAFQEVAIVDVRNPQIVAVGANQMEAIRQYQSLMSANTGQTVLDSSVKTGKVTGVVDRISKELSSNGTIYYLYLKGIPHLFTGDVKLSPKLVITQPGDTITIEYILSGEDVMPIYTFDNTSLPLSKTPMQQQVENRQLTESDAEATQRNAKAIRERLKNMTDKELRELGDKLPNPPK